MYYVSRYDSRHDELPTIISKHETFSEACTAYDKAFEDDANANHYLEITQSSIRRLRLER